jgi:hypothetical protein
MSVAMLTCTRSRVGDEVFTDAMQIGQPPVPGQFVYGHQGITSCRTCVRARQGRRPRLGAATQVLRLTRGWCGDIRPRSVWNAGTGSHVNGQLARSTLVRLHRPLPPDPAKLHQTRYGL